MRSQTSVAVSGESAATIIMASDPMGTKLSLNLYKSHFRVGGPKWRQFDVNSGVGLVGL